MGNTTSALAILVPWLLLESTQYSQRFTELSVAGLCKGGQTMSSPCPKMSKSMLTPRGEMLDGYNPSASILGFSYTSSSPG